MNSKVPSAQHLVRTPNNKTIAPEILLNGNPAQHKTPQSFRGVAYACAGQEKQ